MVDIDSIFIISETINNEDPTKKSKPGVDKETQWDEDNEFEDIPFEDDDIEDIFIYQNSKTRFLKHYL